MLRINLFLGFVICFALGCSTTPSTPEPETTLPDQFSVDEKPTRQTRRVKPSPPVNIDYEGLSRSMSMDFPREDLGLKEQRFNTCSAGYGYSASQDCRDNYMVVINFRLLCRDTEGTVSEAVRAEDMRPLSGRPVSWAMVGNKGQFKLDNQGYGTIKTTSENTSKNERLKITADNDFLYMRANQINQVVTPSNWCN